MINKSKQFAPRARKEGLVVQQLADEILVYDQERFKAHCLNHPAALVWKHCDGKKTASEIAQALRHEVGSPVDEELVWLALSQLGKSRLLTEQVMMPEGQAGISRREVMRRVGIAAAVALPVVTSILAPRAAQAINCKTSGQPCTTGPQCCSTVCNAGFCT